MTYRLQTLGRLRLLNETGREVAFPEKGLLILCLAIANGCREQSRAEIARLLWDGVEPSQAYVNLRKTISRITAQQMELGRTFLTFSQSSILLNPGSLTSDLDAVTDDGDDAVARFCRIATVLRDDFLKDAKSHGKALDAWINRQRETHMSLLRESLLAAAPAAAGKHRDLLKSAAMRLLERSPLDEEVRKILKAALESEGRHHDAQVIFESVSRSVPIIGNQPSAPVEILPRDDSHQRKPPRLVLLPPNSERGDSTAAIFASSLIEDVTIGLCALRSVSVIAPYTAAQIGLQADKANTYERHAISYILDTRLTDEGDRQSLFAQLIFFANDEVIWADRFNLIGDGLMQSRRGIAHRIAAAIASQIEQNEAVRGSYEGHADSYRSYLLGQRHLKDLNLPEIRRARKSFREALGQQAGFAPAMGGLARTYFFEWLLTARNDRELLGLAERHAREAVVADETLASGYLELGVVKLYMRQFDESVEFLDRAEALSPHYANVLASYGDTLVQASRPAEGLQKIKTAIDLNPIAPDNYFWAAAGASYSLGQYEEALGYIDRMRDRAPADRLSAASWGMLGDRRKARQFVRKTFDVHPDFDLDRWMAIVPFREEWQREHYREGLKKAGF
ncbi:DNA-binding SARP family transcriptional activator [Sinorhizobium terangae]|uniref:SARP family transcriptional regulator n=1 Tax=Sinorhizobium terangae TaxID=110322 RepID=A0A6N7LFK7_SINTE|nr:SARP family transcriptional regulator [Sinorhizobium terangae]MBB4186381.1 DNA-binding SARP family transcriptional activator [Sinorhizobium terangae]MQX15989.1 SARP family transcriptional regulator [Sinorhizobium terangae]